MGSKHYLYGIVIRISLLVIAAIGLGIMIYSKEYVASAFILGLVVFLSYLLISFFNRTNEQISFFIRAVKNDDTTLRFPAKTGNRVLNELHKSLNELNTILQETKIRGQIKERYFSEIIQNIGTGILIYNPKEFVLEVNPAALELFGLQTLTHLSQLDRVDPSFREQLVALKNSNKQVLQLKQKNGIVQLIIRCSVINLRDEEVFLLTLQDIKGELERKEIDSWIKLIRVMSHEIMNSLAPITSIAQSLKRVWTIKVQQSPFHRDDDIVNTINGLEVIGERGEALKRFVQSYRILTHVPQPVIKKVGIHNFLDSLSILLSPFKDESDIAIIFHYPVEDFEVNIDEQLLVQVIVNLVKNSVEAFENGFGGEVQVVVAPLKGNHVKFEISDNGPSIPADVLDQIFVPFFTTKPGGTGVGLSHSRQIMRAHGGTIYYSSVKGKTVFTIEV